MLIDLGGKDIIWSYLGTILSMSANFLMLPILIYFLDAETLGLWYVFISIGGIATLFDFGFAVTFARNITYAWSGAKELLPHSVVFADNSEPNWYLMKKVISACKSVYLIISGSALVLLLTIGSWYIIYISHEIDGIQHYAAWLIYSVAIFLNLYYGYYASFLRGVGAIDKVNKNMVVARLAQIMLTLFLLFCGWGIIGASVAYLAYGTIFRLLGKHYFFRYKGIGEKLDCVSEKVSKNDRNQLIKTVWHNAWREGIISISNFLNIQATTLICSMFFTLSQTGIYSITNQFAMAIAVISGTLYMASQPEIQSSYINGDRERTKSIMSFITMSVVYLFVIGIIGVLIIVLPVMDIIKPAMEIPVPIFLGLSCYHFILKIRDCYCSYFSSTNRIIYIKSYILSSFICIVLSVLFCYVTNWGVGGLVISQILSQAVYNTWYWPRKAHLDMGLALKEMIYKGNTRIYEYLHLVKRRQNRHI